MINTKKHRYENSNDDKIHDNPSNLQLHPASLATFLEVRSWQSWRPAARQIEEARMTCLSASKMYQYPLSASKSWDKSTKTGVRHHFCGYLFQALESRYVMLKMSRQGTSKMISYGLFDRALA